MNGKTPEQMEAEISAQRDQLAETVDHLTAKLDVKSQAQAKVADLKHRATTETGRPRPKLLVGAGSLMVAGLALVWWRRRG